jgi:hypothetical protein
VRLSHRIVGDPANPATQSFNPLFPDASFADPIGLFGPTSMIDLTPFISVIPRRGLVLAFERPWYWRESTGDGIYNTALRLLAPPTAGTGRFIGGPSGVLVVWQATRHLQLTGAIIRLASGQFWIQRWSQRVPACTRRLPRIGSSRPKRFAPRTPHTLSRSPLRRLAVLYLMLKF